MRSVTATGIIVFLFVALCGGWAWGREKVLFKETSAYNTVQVVQEGDWRILKVRSGAAFVEESRCDVRHPARLVHEYTQLQTLGLLFPPKMERILVVGLGGGSLSKALTQAAPQAEVVSLELDPLIAECARKFFCYTENAHVKTVVGDGRKFLESDPSRYDLIILDAFDGLEIPAPLRTAEFYQLVKAHLSPAGAVVSNLHLRSRHHLDDRETLESVLTPGYAFGGIGCVIVVSQPGEMRISEADLQSRALSRWPGYSLEFAPAPLLKRLEESKSHFGGMVLRDKAKGVRL